MKDDKTLREEAEKHLYQGYGISNGGGDAFHNEIWNDWLNSMVSFHKSQLEEQRANADVALSEALDFMKRRRETRIDTDDLCGGTQRHAGFNEAVIQLEKYVKSKLTNKEEK